MSPTLCSSVRRFWTMSLGHSTCGPVSDWPRNIGTSLRESLDQHSTESTRISDIERGNPPHTHQRRNVTASTGSTLGNDYNLTSASLALHFRSLGWSCQVKAMPPALILPVLARIETARSFDLQNAFREMQAKLHLSQRACSCSLTSSENR